ncbi:major vault protein isoform X1 [Antechinus flavipes]|uniref:major vault protein isoform X1 n=2 Tax=Antechinus flavipes TaxID=38775 RepID=UPI002236A648|nr:major vault protein isoform X1 [Antechinus flavipes]
MKRRQRRTHLLPGDSETPSDPVLTTPNSGHLDSEVTMANKGDSIIRIPPYHFIHVLDQNSNVSRVEVGPKTYIRQDNERVLFAPARMVTVPPRHYCIVANPVARDKVGSVLFDVATGQVRLRHADLEIRLAQDPFPLYPGEELEQDITPLQVVLPNTALHLKALLDFEDENGERRIAGDEWLFEGPGTYIPQKEVEVVETIQATVIRHNQALRLRARKECLDRDGKQRVTGEEWLVRSMGAYLPGVFEEVLDVVNAVVLTDKIALHLRALQNFRDVRGLLRHTGEEWLVTQADTEAHVPDVYEEVLGIVNITTLGPRNYCVILDPVGPDGKNQLGHKRVVKGEKSFFLHPGERLEEGIQEVFVLSEDEGLLLRALQPLEEGDDGENGKRRAGDRWLIRGPLEYVPPAKVEVIEQRQAIPLDENEGIYVRDIKTGKVRAVVGKTYMLTHDEELWEKELPSGVEELLSMGQDPLADRGALGESRKSGSLPPRDKTRIVSYRVPHNAAVQVYDYREKKARVVFGPELVCLGPEEQFTVLSLSAGRPKRPHARRTLCLLLGPDFFTDVITIETADHARLQLQLAYNWHFEVKDQNNPQEAARLFSVPDFVGDACKAIASRVRGAVASVTFDDFHKNSARIIRTSVFGFEEIERKGAGEDPMLQPRDRAFFPQNGLVISSVDVQSVEPVDQRTRDALQRSVQLAIEITTNSQEAAAKHEAQRLEQEAQGRLKRQKILDQVEAEKAQKMLLLLEAESTAVERTGAAKAEAESRAEAARIEGEGAVLQAKLKAEALAIETEAELLRVQKAREQELAYTKAQMELELHKAEKLAAVEVKKFKEMTEALGSNTIRDLALAGPELQVKLLQGLGLKSTLITDGSTPINLFSTATGLLGLGAPGHPTELKKKDTEM